MMRALTAGFMFAFIAPAVAGAEPINTVFEGIASGAIGEIQFRRQLFRLTTRASDTFLIDAFPGGWSAIALLSISIAGVGSADFTNQARVFVDNDLQVVGVAREVGGDLLDLQCDIDCSTWDLTTSFGPVFDLTPFVGDQFVVTTTLGVLRMQNVVRVSFEAFVIPEPATAFLLASGLVALAVCRRGARTVES